jgi:NAD(P)-dependent dehydrogenase (short-subunit alcohol dehydrogenase family)
MASTETVALVTGGARRIGAAIARDLAANGFAVAIHYNGAREDAARLAADIEAAGGRAALVEADLTDMAAADGLVAAAERALGPVQLLVNNASIFEDDAADDFDWQVWDRHFTSRRLRS